MTSVAATVTAPLRARWRNPSALPGFGLSLGFTLFYLTLIVLIPLSALMIRPWTLGAQGVWDVITEPRVLHALKLSFGASAVAALVNMVIGTIIAWALTRYKFPGKALVDAFVDLPFALPTAVAGIALSTIYSRNGWLGAPLGEIGIKVAYTQLGVVMALIFIGLPFVVRTVQPVMAELDAGAEEAAATLGANRFDTIRLVVLPALMPAILTGTAMAFARAVGEYGSVIFIAGNLPMVSEIAPLLIIIKLEEYNYAGAAAIGLVMLVISLVLLLGLNALQSWQASRR